MDPKPLPDRIRPLEGAGMANLFGNMGYERRRWRIAGPVTALCIVGFLIFLGARAIGL